MATTSNRATWIWYPGDYEIWLGNRMNNRRTERGAFFPPFWKADSHYVTVEFSRDVELAADERIEIAAEGIYNIKLDGKLQFGMPSSFVLPAGRHKLCIKIWNQATPPALYVDGPTVKSGPEWRVTNEDKEWIDESGKASDTSTTEYMQAGCWAFGSAAERPSEFSLAREPKQAVKAEPCGEGMLYDFGCETFGYAKLEGLAGDGEVEIYYGESAEEALDTGHCETLDKLSVSGGRVTDLATGTHGEVGADGSYTMCGSRAFRYVYAVLRGGVTVTGVSMEYEYLPLEYRGSFRCNDGELNRIWDVGAYTMHLTTREFFIDGIKRDRWVWSGDAIQSYLMNWYLFFDAAAVRRTIWLLRGKDPVTAHTNTIMDYTFFWFMSVFDYYMYTGDRAFVEQVYPRMRTMMEYVLGRTDGEGMVEGMAGDWVFVDWADGPMEKQGELSFEQVLFCKSLETMALCAGLAGREEDAAEYERLASELRAKLLPAFWDESRKALVHNRRDGRQSDAVTRYSNMFAVFFGYLSDEQRMAVKQSVLLNDGVMKITTPYMRFYELEALCALGEHEAVMREMKAYWGGMLRDGATSFWEKYNPDESGTQHLAMYGRPYGKSLCHAWGASPIYLLGKYYLGVRPVQPGYAEFEARPVLGGLEWMEGRVPAPHGDIYIYMDPERITVRASESGGGWVWFRSEGRPEVSAGKVAEQCGDSWRVWVNKGEEATIKYN